MAQKWLRSPVPGTDLSGAPLPDFKALESWAHCLDAWELPWGDKEGEAGPEGLRGLTSLSHSHPLPAPMQTTPVTLRMRKSVATPRT